MTGTVITIVGSTDSAIQQEATAIVRAAGGTVAAADILHEGRAFDLFLPVWDGELAAHLWSGFSAMAGVDVFVQPNDTNRRKKLLLADMDATMVKQETLDELAEHLNIKDQVAEITQAAMQGEIDFAESLHRRVRLFKGLDVAALDVTLKTLDYSAGAEVLIPTLRHAGVTCVLVSGGFDMFTAEVARHLGFNKHFGNRLEIVDGKLTGNVLPPILDKFAKEEYLVAEAAALGCDLAATAAVGDGANDVPMLQRAGAGIGHFGKPAVQAATPYQIRHTDLTAILYMQGYRKNEIRGLS